MVTKLRDTKANHESEHDSARSRGDDTAVRRLESDLA
jgi:hypothetical protein